MRYAKPVNVPGAGRTRSGESRRFGADAAHRQSLSSIDRQSNRREYVVLN